MSAINLDDMNLFIQVVEQGNFTRAANYCSIPKSTLSRRISELENGMNIRLLHRSTRRVSLTALGKEFYQRSLHILKQVDETEQALKQQQQQAVGKVRLIAPVMFNYFFLDEITTFRQHYPELVLNIHAQEARLKDVQELNFDILLHQGEPQDSQLICKQVACYRSNFYASPDYLQQMGDPISSACLTSHDIIYLDLANDSSPSWRFIENGCVQWQHLNPKLLVDSAELATRMCSSGLGIAQLPSMLANPLVKQGALKLLFDGRHESKTPVYTLYHDRQRLPKKNRLVISYMKQHLQPKIDLLEGLTDCAI